MYVSFSTVLLYCTCFLPRASSFPLIREDSSFVYRFLTSTFVSPLRYPTLTVLAGGFLPVPANRAFRAARFSVPLFFAPQLVLSPTPLPTCLERYGGRGGGGVFTFTLVSLGYFILTSTRHFYYLWFLCFYHAVHFV